jgi:hypothetical protein
VHDLSKNKETIAFFSALESLPRILTQSHIQNIIKIVVLLRKEEIFSFSKLG